MKKGFLKNNKGFSLVELMVVIVIMLILAAIAVPSFTGMVDEANNAKYTAEARNVYMIAKLKYEKSKTTGTKLDFDDDAAVKAIVKEAGLAESASVAIAIEGEDVKVTYTVGEDEYIYPQKTSSTP